MNVNPVATPGSASTAQFATRAESQRISTSAPARSEAHQRQTALPAEPQGRQAKADTGQESQADSSDLRKAEQLKAFIGDSNMRLSTYHDEVSGRSILEVRDQVTGDVVSQYPSEELIRLYAALRQSFVDQSA